MSSNLGDRTTYLGATDVAAIVGVSPYRSPIDVFLEKTGQSEPFEQTERMRFGQLLEDAIAQGYEERTKRRLFQRRDGVAHHRYPYIIGHPDRLVYEEPGVVELKASMDGRGYGDAGTDAVPPHVRVQVVLYMGLTGRDWCDVALLRGTRGLDIYTVPADPPLYEALIEAAVDFQEHNIDLRVAPPVDGTDSTRQYLASRFPKDDGLEVVATPEQALLVDELRTVTDELKTVIARKSLVENRIREAMGEHTALIGPGFKVTWKASKDRVETDWQAVAHDLSIELFVKGGDESPAGIIDRASRPHTVTKPGPRVLRPTFKEVLEAAA